MNKFELYCMIYYVLDAEWDESKNAELGKFLSSANPFQFRDIGSADPEIYEEFCKEIPDTITRDDSYGYARNYVESLGNRDVQAAFLTIDREEWDECLHKYLSQEHKGRQGV